MFDQVMRIFKAKFVFPRVIAILISVVGISACDRGTPIEIHDDGEQLEEIIEQFVQLQGRIDGQDPIFSTASFKADIEQQRELLHRVRAIRSSYLSVEQNTDRRFLTGLLETDIRSAEVRRRWENDPAMYLSSRQIGLLMDPAAPESAEQRAGRLSELLEALPRQLDLARANLKHPPARFTTAAIFQVESTLRTMSEGEAIFSGLAVKERIVGAREALLAYQEFLQQDLLPRSNGNWAIGKQEYDFILKHRWFLHSDADDILMRGRKAFADTEALAQELAGRMAPGKHWTEVYETLKDDHPDAADIKQAYQDQIDAARRFILEHQIVTLPAGEHVVTLDTPLAMRRSSPFGTFQSVPPLGDGLEGRLLLTPIEAWMSPEQRQARLRSHHRAWIPIIAVHEAYPGHHVHALKTRENPRILRKVAREPIFSEGWGLFTEELMYELGFLQGDDVRLTQLRNRLWRAARVILDSSLHTGKMSFDEAVDFLVEKVRFERYAAELEVGMYTRRPTYVLGYLIGMQELMAIREEYVQKHGNPTPPSQFYDRLLSIGSIPPALVREELLGAGAR